MPLTEAQKRALARRRALRRMREKRLEARRRVVGGDDRVLSALQQIERNSRDFGQRMSGIDRRVRLMERVNRQRHVSLPGVEDGDTFRGEKRKFMFTRAIRYLLTGNERGNEFEAAVMRETEKKAGTVEKTVMIAGTDSIGGFLVPVEVTGELIDLIRANLVVEAAGVRYLPNLTGSPVTIQKKTSGGTGYWVGEIEAPTESNMAWGEINLTPKTAAGLMKLSKRLINLANQAAEQLVREDLSEVLALLIDLAVLRGTGSTYQPLGIANTPGINSYPIGTNGGPITEEVLRGMRTAVRNANGLKNAKKVGWITSPEAIAVIEGLKDSDGRPLFKAGGSSAEDDPVPTRLLGYEVHDTTQIPTNLTKGTGTALTELYFGDFDTVMVGQWGGLEIAVSDQTSDAFEKRQVWVLAHQDLDVGVREEVRLCYCNDADSA